MDTKERVVRVIAQDPGVVMMLGAPDRGKTTWCLQLANELSAMGKKVALVDADIGQSDLGPPTTIAMSCLGGPVQDWQQLRPQAGFFVGTTSPPGVEGWCVAGASRMVQAAWKRGCDVVLVDTTGLVGGRYGRYLKGAKIEALRPRHLVAVERGDELAGLLKGWPVPAGRIHRLEPPPGVESRDGRRRRELREQAYRRFWQGARAWQLSLARIPCWRTRYRSATPLNERELQRLRERSEQDVVYAEWQSQGVWAVRASDGPPPRIEGLHWAQSQNFKDLLVALVGEDPDQITVGVLEEIDWVRGQVLVFAPPVEEVHGLIFGLMRVDRCGDELGRLRLDDI